MRRPVVSCLLVVVGLATVPTVDAQETPALYAHVGAGVGVGLLNSSEITDVAAADYGIGLGGSYSLLGRVGFRQVVQAEFRWGTESHPFRLVGLVSGGTQPFGILDELEMDYDFTEWTGKLNPFFSNPRRFSPFVVVGRSKADFLNSDGEGFEGTGTIVGVEFIGITRALSITLGFKRHAMTFTAVTPEIYGATLDPTAEFSGANWILDATFAFGVGM